MDVYVMSGEAARNFIPKRETYVIRIFNSDNSLLTQKMKEPLLENPLSVVNEYIFDDVDLDSGKMWGIKVAGDSSLFKTIVPFEENIATKILEDFVEHKNTCEDLLVHCTMGVSRSPAVAIALNEVFNLGQPFLEQKYPLYNKYVARLLQETAGQLGYGRG